MSIYQGKLVRVRLFAAARAAVGRSEIETEPASVQEILDRISTANLQAAQVFSRCSILIDGQICHDLALHVNVGQEMDVLPPFAGGAL